MPDDRVPPRGALYDRNGRLIFFPVSERTVAVLNRIWRRAGEPTFEERAANFTLKAFAAAEPIPASRSDGAASDA